jgi:hypothetical protein
MNAFISQYIDIVPQQILEIKQQSSVVEEASPGLQLHQEIKVTFRSDLAPHY